MHSIHPALAYKIRKTRYCALRFSQARQFVIVCLIFLADVPIRWTLCSWNMENCCFSKFCLVCTNLTLKSINQYFVILSRIVAPMFKHQVPLGYMYLLFIYWKSYLWKENLIQHVVVPRMLLAMESASSAPKIVASNKTRKPLIIESTFHPGICIERFNEIFHTYHFNIVQRNKTWCFKLIH